MSFGVDITKPNGGVWTCCKCGTLWSDTVSYCNKCHPSAGDAVEKGAWHGEHPSLNTAFNNEVRRRGESVSEQPPILSIANGVFGMDGEGALTCGHCGKQYHSLSNACMCKHNAPPTSILTEAASLISGDRRDAYGSYAVESKRIAAMWSVILHTEVKPEQVPLCMIALKLVRESHQHKRDSLVDICGYAALLDQLYEK